MTIAAVQEGNRVTFADSNTTISLAYASNVTAGNLLVIGYGGWRSSDDATVVGDITQSAGTATLSSFQLDKNENYNHTGSNYLGASIFSARVTGTGSCTIQIAGAPAGSYIWIGLAEYSATNGWDDSRVETTNSGNGATGGPTSGNMTSAGGALFTAVCATNTSVNTTHTPDTNWTTAAASEDGSAHGTGELIRRIVTGGTTDDGNWTAPTTVQWAAVGVVYKEQAAAGGVPTAVFINANQII